MRKLAYVLMMLVAAVGGLGAAIALAAGETTGTNTACATATLPAHTVGVDSTDVFTISGTSTSACHTETYTIPTSTVTVTASSTTSSTTTSSTTTTTTTTPPPPPPSGLQIGAPTPAGVTCTRTLDAGADVSGALSSAAPGSTVCLNAGAWPAITLSSVAPASPGVTLAATPGQKVTLTSIRMQGANTQNLTIEGFYITSPAPQGNAIDTNGGSNGGVVIQYNTLEHQSKNNGVYFAGGTWKNTTVQWNMIDHDGGGVASNTNTPGLTIQHNVIGPGIGYGVTDQAHDEQHYIQAGGPGLLVDHNAILGPYDPTARMNGVHNNVLHAFNGNTGITFTNNLVWHTNTMGSASVLLQDQLTNVTIENNLDVEDPADNFAASNTWVEPYEVWGPHGLLFENNTTVNGVGIILGRVVLDSFTDPNNMTATGNISAPPVLVTGLSPLYRVWKCTSVCSTGNNVTADGSANSVLGGTGNVVNWTANWQSTDWTAPTGPPWSPPPQGYYQPPAGDSAAGMGWQGSICTASIRSSCIGP